jgi:hypothetical protein
MFLQWIIAFAPQAVRKSLFAQQDPGGLFLARKPPPDPPGGPLYENHFFSY